jgi:hypothetical protein
MDDFLFLADSYPAALRVQARVDTLLAHLGILRNPKKGI